MKFQKVLNELEQSGAQNDRIQTDKSKKYLNITRDTGEFFTVLVKATKAKNILELGTSNGYSTLWLASALPENGTVTTIERSEQKAKEAKANFERTNLLERIQLLIGNASDLLNDLKGEFDIIFLDADRSAYISFIPHILRLLKSGGIMICDNAFSHEEELKEFMEFFINRSEYTTCLVPVGKGEFIACKGKLPC
ncbi:O-methyltransferase [uncultured Desulfosarcina sp.]|uniref:O-methyltransferase n=1 Tax=uncultured Desulfosarcina sp. TaxID=218289 RepID=UPI0029C91867|nr:O-methyltransferase [uncultured Desulfosarcina sp.]